MPVRGIGTDEILPHGGLISRLCAYTLATYSAAGTTPPADGDIVTFSSGADNRVVLAPDNTVGMLGRVKGAPNTTDLTVNVEWFDIYAFVELTTDDLSTITLGDAVIKDGNTTVVNNFDAGATTGNLKAIAKSGSSGAGTVCAAVCIL
jgi:hypothetical protein